MCCLLACRPAVDLSRPCRGLLGAVLMAWPPSQLYQQQVALALPSRPQQPLLLACRLSRDLAPRETAVGCESPAGALQSCLALWLLSWLLTPSPQKPHCRVLLLQGGRGKMNGCGVGRAMAPPPCPAATSQPPAWQRLLPLLPLGQAMVWRVPQLCHPPAAL